MIALIVIAVIVLIFALLFSFSIRAEIKYLGGEFDLRVKYMFFTVYPKKEKPEKPKKKKRGKKGEAAEESAADKPEHEIKEEASGVKEENAVTAKPDDELLTGEKKGKKGKEKEKNKKKVSLSVRIEQGKILWGCVKKPLKRLFKGIYISGLTVNFIAGGEDAYKAAMTYGTMNAVVYNALSFIRVFFPVSVNSVDINCDFDSKKSVYDVSCSVKLKLGTAVAVLLTAGIGVLLKWNDLGFGGKEGPKENDGEKPQKPEKSKVSA